MVKTRIPGLDHSLLEDGSWMPDDNYHRIRKQIDDDKRATAKAERKRVRESASGQIPLGDAVAPR